MVEEGSGRYHRHPSNVVQTWSNVVQQARTGPVAGRPPYQSVGSSSSELKSKLGVRRVRVGDEEKARIMRSVKECLKMGCWTVIKSFHVKIILLDKQELIQEIQVRGCHQALVDVSLPFGF